MRGWGRNVSAMGDRGSGGVPRPFVSKDSQRSAGQSLVPEEPAHLGPARPCGGLPMFREISPMHLGLILLAFVILFGYKKLRDAPRSLGRSRRIFKSEVKGLHDAAPQAEPADAGEIAAPAVPTQAAAVPISEKTLSVGR